MDIKNKGKKMFSLMLFANVIVGLRSLAGKLWTLFRLPWPTQKCEEQAPFWNLPTALHEDEWAMISGPAFADTSNFIRAKGDKAWQPPKSLSTQRKIL